MAEQHEFTIGGRHRQRATLRLFSYWATGALMDDGSVFYVSIINDDVGLVAAPKCTIRFDKTMMSPDEAARQDIGLYIADRSNFEPGEPPAPLPKGVRWL